MFAWPYTYGLQASRLIWGLGTLPIGSSMSLQQEECRLREEHRKMSQTICENKTLFLFGRLGWLEEQPQLIVTSTLADTSEVLANLLVKRVIIRMCL